MPKQRLKQRADGRYRCKADGQYFYGNTQSEALAAREQYERLKEAGLRRESAGETVASYAMRWLPVHKVGIRNSTYNAYANYLNTMCRVLGDKLVRDITPSDIKEVYNSYMGKSDSTIKKAVTIYKALFDSAIADGLIRTNPCKADSAKPHKGSKGTHRAISKEERQLIHSVDHRMRPAAMAMLYAGIRRGEAMALNVDEDIDFNTRTIFVHAAVHFEGNRPVREERTKTEAGRRTIPLFDPLAQCLSNAHGLLLPSASGDLCTEMSFSRAWDSYILALSKAAGKPISIRAHDLRHSFCTMLCDCGVDLKIAILWMGHSDEKMILQVYDHVTPEREEKAAKIVDIELSRGQIGGQIPTEPAQPVDL